MTSTYMIPEKAGTRTTIVAVELQLGPECAMKDISGSGLHAGNVNRIKAFVIEFRVAILLHDKLTVFELDVLSIVLHIESNVGIVRILLEIIDHPGIHERFGFALGFVEQVVDIRRLREVLNDSMSVDTAVLFIFPATWTAVRCRMFVGGGSGILEKNKSENGGRKHIVK